MRFGVIGCGTVSETGHMPALAASSETKLTALADIRQNHLQEVGKQYGIKHLYTDYRELLARPDIDAVTVATPLGSHYEVVMAALQAGKHVFCEKPLASNVYQGKAMVRAAEKAHRLLAVNFEMRAGHFCRAAKEIIESGEIGRVRYLRMVYNWAGPRWASDNRHSTLMTEGMGPVVDCGVHFFDLARWFSGSNFMNINAAGIHIENYPHPDHVTATCTMENGTLVVIDESWVFGHTAPVGDNYLLHRIDIEGENGTITTERTSFQTPTIFSVQSPRGVRQESAPEKKAFNQMYSLFVQSVKAGRLIDLASGADGIMALEAALAALHAASQPIGDNTHCVLPIGNDELRIDEPRIKIRRQMAVC